MALDPRTPESQPKPKADAQSPSHPGVPPVFFFLRFIYLFMRDREKEAETQAEGEAGSSYGA